MVKRLLKGCCIGLLAADIDQEQWTYTQVWARWEWGNACWFGFIDDSSENGDGIS